MNSLYDGEIAFVYLINIYITNISVHVRDRMIFFARFSSV